MILCKHETCGREKKLWLPIDNNYSSEIVLHSWCKNCGKIKVITDERPHNLGYWMNILSRISKHFPLKDVQKRLIAKSLEIHDCFNDLYSINGSIQKEVFKKIVTRFCLISEQSIDSLIY